MPEYFAGTADAHEARRLEEHINGCSACSAEHAEYRKMITAISEPVAVPLKFKASLRHMVQKEARKQLPTGMTIKGFLKNPFFKVLVGATAASLLLLAGGFIWFDMIFPKPLQETVVSYVDDRAAGLEEISKRGLAQLVPDNSATAKARLFVRYGDELASEIDDKVISIGGEVLNSANKSNPYALYGVSPDVLSFLVNFLKSKGPVDAAMPRITSVSSDTVYMLLEIRL